MSGVYVKDWEVPYCCAVCPFEDFDNERLRYICTIGHADIDYGDYRHPDCPLVPVPPHGALMDRDDFFATCPELVDGYKRITDDLVVFPAEEGYQ